MSLRHIRRLPGNVILDLVLRETLADDRSSILETHKVWALWAKAPLEI